MNFFKSQIFMQQEQLCMLLESFTAKTAFCCLPPFFRCKMYFSKMNPHLLTDNSIKSLTYKRKVNHRLNGTKKIESTIITEISKYSAEWQNNYFITFSMGGIMFMK